ncbi:ABC transporter ATP-binding protein [Chelatococcus reniformis]|uniref:ABC transporter ATP-binding protein n=1 Tax=Chelatococcus reniformis TaxID=1494448 RepID=A0A916UVD0_9HYPH|nr:ABC transporter ATP-binding protein [Chelatococcus reniformis]GGC86965.1 ABC transporter ATP-binding protein [Chelatococcus reniformis]
MLTVEHLSSRYGRIEALHDVTLHVAAGEIIALVGSNGAGKTTLLKALSGVQPIVAGRVRFDGREIQRIAAHRRVRLGLVQVPEGRQVFGPLSVEENLLVGAWTRGRAIADDLARIFVTFPMLADFRHRAAGTLSGGQQQMLAIGRALMARPRLLLLDEPSMGLAPLLIDQIFAIIADIRSQGVTVLVVEQNVQAALAIADRGYVLETGRITLEGSGRSLICDDRVRQAYLGVHVDA